MANLNENLTKYLDYNGLGQFLVKLKEYIADRISEVNGSNLNLYNSGETNPTIASEIERIWTVLGEGGDVSISGQIQSILGQYVKDIQQGTGNHAGLDDLIKVSVVEGTGDSKDIYTISLEGTGLVEKLQDLTSERVSSIDATGTDGGAVTLSIDKSKGDVKLTVNSKALTERVETLESRSGKYNSGYNINSGYLLGGANTGGWEYISPTNLKYSFGYNGLELGWRGSLTIGTDFYGGIILGTMPDSTDRYINIAPEHSTGGITIGSGSVTIGTCGMTIGSDIIIGSNDIIIGSGGIFIGSNVNLGTIQTGVNNDIILRGHEINLNCDYGVKINNVIVGTSENSSSPVFPNFTCIKGNLIGTAQDSLSLGGQLPSYYATKEDVQSIQDSYVKDITTSNSNTGTKYVTISPNTATKDNVTITIDDTAAKEKFESIDNYTINGKKISGSPTLTGDDITLGKSIGDNTNYPTTMDIPEAIQKLRETMTGLGKVVNLSGVYEKWEDYTGTPVNGDFVIVGQKEYVYWDKWIELGDTTQVTQYLNDLINKYNSHTHSFTPTGTVTSTFAGAQNTTSSNSLNISYTSGRLIIKSSHAHTVTPTGTVTSTFNGGSGTSGPTGLIQSLPPVEPSAPDSFNPGGGDSPEPTIDYSKEYFTIEALEDGLTVQLSQNASQYRIDNGDWISLAADTATPSINSGQKISFKITNPTILTSYGIGTFTINKAFNVEGNIMSLLYGDNFEGQIDLSGKKRAFLKLFYNHTTTLKNAKNLILPATTLASYCYSNMFYGCKSLTMVPQLPATTLASYCYSNMFYGCTGLTTAPELPATTLASSCYYYMFYGCTSLTTAPELPATTLAESCYSSMFKGCTSLASAPELPATTLASGCYSDMFNGCTSLTTAPELPAISLAEHCYQYMFEGCSKLNYIKMLATYINANKCLYYWVSGVSPSGTFVKNIAMTSLPNGNSGIPNGWTVKNTFNNISPCIINQDSESITFVYSDGLFTPTNKIIDLSQHFTKDELLSVQPECEITVTLIDKTDNVLASDYVWANDKTLGDILNELGVTQDVYDINVIITNVNAPEDSGYYYDYMLDETEPTEPFVEKDWMRVVSLEDDNTISLSKDIQYSVNGDDWRKLYAYNTIIVNSDDIVYFKGTNTGNQFTVSKAFNVEGNIMSLLYGGEFEGRTDLSGKNKVFYQLFWNCTTLQNAENLILPATTLANNCYESMFYGCTSLTTTPELPATTLASYCYYAMFQDCISLNTAPKLPATTLADYCYSSMFYGTNVLPDCSNIDFANEVVVTSGGLKGLFAGTKVTDTDLERILPKNNKGKYCLPATTLASYCYSSMFSGCTSLTTAPELPATTLAERCYNQMFLGCTSLTTAPELLPATTLAESCYSSMFWSCTSLTTAPQLPATTLASYCYSSMFRGCTSLTTAPELPATTLAASCYDTMFYQCRKLNYIKMLATNIKASNCLMSWVLNVASRGTFVKNATMTSLSSGANGIPSGWTVVNA